MIDAKALPIALLILALAACSTEEAGRGGQTAAKSVHDFAVRDIDGNEVQLGDYRGKVVLIVNVASKCGFTRQYAGLQSIYARYRDRGFAVLGFPANDFGAQEPGTDAEIKAFCTLTHQVTFPMFAKIGVVGETKAPLYAFLTDEATNPEVAGEITWNFNKFLVGKGGEVIARFEPSDEPESAAVVQAIERALE